MKKNLLLLSFDIEEFDLPEEYGAVIPEVEKYRISAEGTAAILDVLAAAGIVATFFVTGNFAERYPDLVIRMVRDGHEVASHGMDHSFFTVSHLAESRAVLERISGRTVTGFRMARLAPVAKEDILASGYRYESSLNPVWLPGRYNNFTSPLLPFREKCGLLQFPVSALPLVRFPLFWLSFKNLPQCLYNFFAGCAVGMTGYYNMYSHPWEYHADARDKRWQIPGFVTRHAGSAQLKRLANLVEYLKKKGSFVTFETYLAEHSATEIR